MKIKNEFFSTRKFLKASLARTILVVAILFFGIIIFAAYAGYNDTNTAKLVLSEYMGGLSGIVDKSGNIQVIKLFLNNLFACGISLGIGLIPFVFLPILSLISNATIIGILLGYGEATGQINALRTVIFGLLPHGIFEIPAMLLSMSMGIYFCKTLSVKIVTRDKNTKILDLLNEITRVFVLIILPLLVFAAVIEAYVTPLLTVYI